MSKSLEGVYYVLRKNTIFFCAGYALVYASLLVFNLNTLILLIGGALWGFPVLVAFFFGGFGNALLGPIKADYEVVTVNGAGTITSSDGGSQSIMNNFVIKLFLLGGVYCIALVIVPIHIIFLSIKGIVLYIKEANKPSFIKSVFFLMLINLAVLILSPIVFGYIHEGKRGAGTSGDYRYVLNEAKDSVVIEGYRGKGGDVVIPETLGGLPVVGIDSNAFWINSDITSVIIPEGVIDIGGNAFERNAKLVSVTLPKSLRRMGSGAFRDCASLVDVTIPPGSAVTYGRYTTANYGSASNAIFIESMKMYFNAEGQDHQVYHAFSGSSNLSAASRQALRDTGYTGEF